MNVFLYKKINDNNNNIINKYMFHHLTLNNNIIIINSIIWCWINLCILIINKYFKMIWSKT